MTIAQKGLRFPPGLFRTLEYVCLQSEYLSKGNNHQNILSKWPKGCHFKFSRSSMLLREVGYKKLSATYKIQKNNVSPKRNIACKRNSSVFSCVLLVLIETSPVPYLVLPSQCVKISFKRSFPIPYILKYKRFKKIAWVQSHHLQWKFKLLAGKFTWGVKTKHCWAMSTNFWNCWHQPAMFCLITSNKLSHQ